MNPIPVLTTFVALGLVACDTMTAPLTSGDYNPLLPPGSNRRATPSASPSFAAGEFVRASMNNTAFFKIRPNGDADADKLLKQGTSMKVISLSGSYVRVELDSGEVGFVPSVMLENPNAPAQTPMLAPGQYQVYPPLPGGGSGIGQPLPTFDPAGLPPEGAIPTVIDPDSPRNNAPVPPITPTTDTFQTPPPPVEPKVEATPPPPAEPEKKPEEVVPKLEKE